ncbi:MAG: PEP-CTERM sorting domain-containing protein [Isosphaeraceae bacterium]
MRSAFRLPLTRALQGAVAALAFGLWVPAASAQVIVTAIPSAGSAAQGSTLNVLTIQIFNDSLATTLSGFNITLQVSAASGITFTGADTSVPNYVFNGNSFGFLFTNPGGSNTVDISDSAADLDASFPIGSTFAVGRIFYSVSNAAPLGLQNVSLEAATSFTSGLTDGVNSINYSSSTPLATINITPLAAVPEPSPLFLVGAASAGLVVTGWLRRRRAGSPSGR